MFQPTIHVRHLEQWLDLLEYRLFESVHSIRTSLKYETQWLDWSRVYRVSEYEFDYRALLQVDYEFRLWMLVWELHEWRLKEELESHFEHFGFLCVVERRIEVFV